MRIQWFTLCLILLTACSDTVPTEQAFQLAERGIISASLTENGDLAFVGSFGDGGGLWRMTDHERLFNWNHSKNELTSISASAFSEDGQFVVTTADRDMALWNTSTGQPIRFWRSPSRITSIDIARQYVLIGQANNNAVVFDTIKGGIIGSLQHSTIVSEVSLDDAAKFALTGSHDGAVRYWSLDNGAEIYTWPHRTPIELVQLSQNGRYALSVAYQGEVSLWDTRSGELIKELYRKNPGIISARFSQDQLLLGTSREKVILWDLVDFKKIRTWKIPNAGPWRKAAVISVAFSKNPSGYRIIASDGISYVLGQL